jgi:Arc/MetJ family transcription regulator
MRATIAIDDRLFEEAKRLSGIKTKRELVNLSLLEFVRKRRLEHLAGMYGSGAVNTTCEELEEYRSHEE